MPRTLLSSSLSAPLASLAALAIGVAACSGAKLSELNDVAPGGAAPTATTPSGGGPDGGKGKGGGEDGGNGEDAGDSSVPEETDLCDDGLSLTSTNAYDAAKAIGLCAKSSVISARYIKPDGTAAPNPDAWGLLPKLGGNKAPSGKVMLALSSGAARGPGDPGYKSPSGYDKSYTHAAPLGQPKHSSVCTAPDSAQGTPHDGVALELVIRVPNGAKSMSFTHQLFTYDYPAFVCSQYNDAFVVMMEPKPAGTDGNIVFDALGNQLGVNSTELLRACMPGTNGGLTFTCPLGPSSLGGTGFEDKAATGWLRTTVPVQANTNITLKFAIWDAGDGILDSTVLVDELAFSTTPAAATATVPR